MPHAFQVIERFPTPALPILATANDVREVVHLLKKRPEGITIVEASDALRKRLFDPRKVAAYELWGVVSRSDARIKLSELGREFAASLEPEARLYRVMLDNTPPYRAALEWVHGQGLDLVTRADVTAYWEDHFPEALQRDEKTSEGHVVSFLHLCHAAEIGTATVGRKGQPSRLRLDRDELAAYIRATPRTAAGRAFAAEVRPGARRPAALGPAAPPRLRVFISTPDASSRIVAGVQDALQVADIGSEVVERETSGGELVSGRAFRAMRRCDAGIVVVGRADCRAGAGGGEVLNQTTVVEIGAASVHFARRLVLLHDGQVPFPFSLEGFCHYEVQGDELTWETGLRLIKSVKLFRTAS